MTLRPKLSFFLALPLLLTWAAALNGQSPDTRPTTIIKVGVITYADYDSTYVDAQQNLAGLAENYNKSPASKANKVSFQLAVGSYDDVLDWYKNGFVNVAILSPGPVAALLASDGDWDQRIKELYIGTTVAKPAAADNNLAVPERRHGINQVQYHAVCVVASDSSIKDLADLKEGIKEHKVDFLFVDPLSASGRILPEYLLRNLKGIKPEDLSSSLLDAKWTYGHDASVKALQQPAVEGRVKVAFVWDNVGDYPAARAAIHKIPIPELDQLSIPQEIVLISSEFKDQKQTQLVKDIFVPKEQSPRKYIDHVEWLEDYRRGIVEWMKALEHKPDVIGKRHVGLQEIIDKVRSYENSHPGGARLALVLSGGGAKCAYQTGVIKAIESELTSSNELAGNGNSPAVPEAGVRASNHSGKPARPKSKPLDIDLVVGTSGGAINALAVALGLTQNEDGQEALGKVWLSFKQQDFFRPWSPMPVTLGLIVGLGQALILILGLRLRDDERIKWRKWTRPSVITLAVVAIILLLGSWRFWASIPLIAMLVLIGVQLYDNQAKDWRLATGIGLFLLGTAELVVAKLDVTPWRYVPYLIPAVIFIALGFTMILATRVLTLDGDGWRKFARIAIPVITSVEIVILWIWKTPVIWLTQLSKNHMSHHLWMTLSMNLVLSALFLMVLGLLMLAADWFIRSSLSQMHGDSKQAPQLATSNRSVIEKIKQGLFALADSNAKFFGRRRPILSALTIALVSLSALQLIRTFLLDKSLSQSEGVDRAFVEKLPLLLQHHPAIGTLIKPQGDSDQQRLADISNQILSRQLLKRDLVITSSLLGPDVEQSDLYFYYQHAPNQRPAPDKTFPPDNRFRSFQDTELTQRLLDVVIGSATIYPVFGPRHLVISRQGAGVDIIDGGFAHNSPIEAAVAWGATHIILIEASPKAQPSQHRHLLDNSLDAFNYLFNEAQLVDAHSRGKIEIFSIRPDGDDASTDANLCTFDFDDSLMEGAIEKGWNDALNVDRPKFERRRGQPIF